MFESFTPEMFEWFIHDKSNPFQHYTPPVPGYDPSMPRASSITPQHSESICKIEREVQALTHALRIGAEFSEGERKTLEGVVSRLGALLDVDRGEFHGIRLKGEQGYLSGEAAEGG